jgi:hypothetical protein
MTPELNRPRMTRTAGIEAGLLAGLGRVIAAIRSVLRRARQQSRATGMTRRAQGLAGCLCTDAW